MSNPVEDHPFPPVLTREADVLMMGTFPPTSDKWAMEFHYPNFYNDMWRMYGQIFFENKEYFRVVNEDGKLEKRFNHHQIIDFLNTTKIASCPTVRKAIREEGNASDKHLTVVEPVHLSEVLNELPKVHTIFTTGGKATEILIGLSNNALPINTPKRDLLKLPKTNESTPFYFSGRELTLYRLPSTSKAYPLAFDKKVEAYQAFFRSVNKI